MAHYRNSPHERLITLQIIDVNLNRASEGIRVVEEYCRFALGDVQLVARCKALRDQLHLALEPISRAERLLARDTPNDVGANTDFTEEIRAEVSVYSIEQVAIKNAERVKEALRVIEECSKASHPEVARAVGNLRYHWYTLEKDCHFAGAESPGLRKAQLYVLIDGSSAECEFVERVQLLIDAGVHILQLRDKKLDDRTLFSRAQLLRRVIDASSQRPLMIINDRADIAVLSRADGVHVGQEELEVHQVRQIVGASLLIGVSTHTIEQARQAVRDGASYIGCGPTFPSDTKHFDHFPGLDFLRQVAAEIALPAFAIGGITLENLPQVLSAGFSRVAVGGAIWKSATPDREAAQFVKHLARKASA